MSDLQTRLSEYADEIERRIASGYFQPCGSDAAKLMREARVEIEQLLGRLYEIKMYADSANISALSLKVTIQKIQAICERYETTKDTTNER